MSLRRKFRNLGIKVKNGAKKVGSTVKKTVTKPVTTVKKVGRAVKNTVTKPATTAKKVGRAVKKVVKTSSRKVKNGAKKVGGVVKNAARTTGRVVKNTAKRITKTADFKLNCHFFICHDEVAFTDVEVKNWIEERVKVAENLFAMKPRLKINYSFSRVKNGSNFLTMDFKSNKDYSSFMNKRFDNTSNFFRSGSLNFLVADSWSVEEKNLCGKAFFPIYPGWKKNAVYMKKDCRTATFSHEIGHVLGLHHTFERGGLCTAKYPKRKGGTFKNNRINLMDYEVNGIRASSVFINDCQERAAAMTRRRLMSVTGKVKYRRLSGWI
jgi:hypothetical protein